MYTIIIAKYTPIGLLCVLPIISCAQKHCVSLWFTVHLNATNTTYGEPCVAPWLYRVWWNAECREAKHREN